MLSQENQVHNRQIFIDTLTACGRHDHRSNDSNSAAVAMDTDERPGRDLSPEMYEVVAILMVELVTPDVIYNAIVPWPEEEFMKITVER